MPDETQDTSPEQVTDNATEAESAPEVVPAEQEVTPTAEEAPQPQEAPVMETDGGAPRGYTIQE